MRAFGIRSIAAALLLTAASPALADSAFLSAAAGTNGWSYSSEDVYRDGGAIELAASGVHSFTPEIGAQGDLVFDYHQNNLDDYDMDTTEFNAAVHGFFRNETYLIGGFVQLGKTRVEAGKGDPMSWTSLYAGAEAQFYFDTMTLYGQAGVSGTSNDEFDAGDSASVFADLELRYFVTDDLRLDASIGLDSAKIDDYDVKIDTMKLGAGLEYKLQDSPISLFGRFDYYRSEQDGGAIDGYRVLAGLKFNFGDETLKARDRTGPSLDTVLPVNMFSGRS